MTFEVRQGDARSVLGTLPEASVQCVVTSIPYWGLRSYGTPPQIWGGDGGHRHRWGAQRLERVQRGPRGESTTLEGSHRGRLEAADRGCRCRCGAWRGELGLEPTPWLFVEHVVEVFREARRVLRQDGTLWLNVGDSYASSSLSNHSRGKATPRFNGRGRRQDDAKAAENPPRRPPAEGLKPKDRIGIPHRIAFALQADGWWWRDEIVWHKPAPMPSSVVDRTTPAHEFVFLFTRSRRYFYDAAAIAEPVSEAVRRRPEKNVFSEERPVIGPFRCASRRSTLKKTDLHPQRRVRGFNSRWDALEDVGAAPENRNKRSVWRIASQPFPEAHFAVMPEALVEPCILAGSKPGDTVADFFCGSGTVGVVALRHGRHFIGSDLNGDYCAMARRRIAGPLFADQGSEASA